MSWQGQVALPRGSTYADLGIVWSSVAVSLSLRRTYGGLEKTTLFFGGRRLEIVGHADMRLATPSVSICRDPLLLSDEATHVPDDGLFRNFVQL